MWSNHPLLKPKTLWLSHCASHFLSISGETMPVWIEAYELLCLIGHERWEVWPRESFLVCFNCQRLQGPSANWLSVCCNVCSLVYLRDTTWVLLAMVQALWVGCGEYKFAFYFGNVFTTKEVKNWGPHRYIPVIVLCFLVTRGIHTPLRKFSRPSQKQTKNPGCPSQCPYCDV